MNEARHQKIVIKTGAVSQEISKYFADTLNIPEFQCSSGWLQKFKEVHNIAL